MCLIVTRVILIGLLVAWPSQGVMNKDEIYPNLKCHPATPASPDNTLYIENMDMQYGGCISKTIITYYDCPKACKLQELGVITDNYSDTYRVVVDNFIEHFAYELGYDLEKPEPAQKQLMDKMRAGVNDCKSKHKEFQEMIMTRKKNITCQPFDNFLKCFEKTIGC